MSASSPAGWYPQPDGSQRYWDGAAWTEHHAPEPALPVAHYGAAPGMPREMSRGMVTPMAVAPKNPTLALLASFFIPGLGTMVNGEGGKGAAILLGYIVSVFLCFVLIGFPLVLGLWIWGMVDAYTGAQRWNAAHGILS